MKLNRRFQSAPGVMGLATCHSEFYGAAILIRCPSYCGERSSTTDDRRDYWNRDDPDVCASIPARADPGRAFQSSNLRHRLRLAHRDDRLLPSCRIDQLGQFTALLVAGFLAANLFFNALGGWLGDVVGKGDEGKLGASFTIGNVGGFGLGAISFITLMRWLPEQHRARRGRWIDRGAAADLLFIRRPPRSGVG